MFWHLLLVPLVGLIWLNVPAEYLLPADDCKWLPLSWCLWMNFRMFCQRSSIVSWQAWYIYWLCSWTQTAFMLVILDSEQQSYFLSKIFHQDPRSKQMFFSAQLALLAISSVAEYLFPILSSNDQTCTASCQPVTFVRDLWIDNRIGSRRFTVPVELYYPVRPTASLMAKQPNTGKRRIKSEYTKRPIGAKLINENLAEWKSFYSQLSGISRHLLGHLSLIRTQSLSQNRFQRTNAPSILDDINRKSEQIQVLPVADSPASLPILIVPQDYNGYQVNAMRSLCEQIASEGWLVVSIQHYQRPGDSFLGELPLFPVPPFQTKAESNNNNEMARDYPPAYQNDDNSGECPFRSSDRRIFTAAEQSQNRHPSYPSGNDNIQDDAEERLQQQWDTWNRRLERRSAEISFVLDRLMAAQYGQPLSNDNQRVGGRNYRDPDGGGDNDDDDGEEEEDLCIRLFKSRLDLERIAILGHSFGATIAVQSAAQDRRLKAIVGLDCWTFPLSSSLMERGLCTPALFIQSGPTFIAAEQPYGTDNDQDLRRLVVNTRASCLLRLKRSCHFDFLDIPGINVRLGWWMGIQSAMKFPLRFPAISENPAPHELFKHQPTAYPSSSPSDLTVKQLSMAASKAFLIKHVRFNRNLLPVHKKFGFDGPVLKRKSFGLTAGSGSGLFSVDVVSAEEDSQLKSCDILGILDSDIRYDGVLIERVGYQS